MPPEFDDHYRDEIDTAMTAPTAYPDDPRYAALYKASRLRRAESVGHDYDHNGHSPFEALAQASPPAVAPAPVAPAVTAEEVNDLRVELENLRECLNSTLDIITELAKEDSKQERVMWLLNDRMGIVERRVHQLEWNDGVADVYRDMATS